jgi:hypothetical protein
LLTLLDDGAASPASRRLPSARPALALNRVTTYLIGIGIGIGIDIAFANSSTGPHVHNRGFLAKSFVIGLKNCLHLLPTAYCGLPTAFINLMRGLSADILLVVHIAKEIKKMNSKKVLAFAVFILLAATCLAQGARGKAELKAGDGSITIDYGQPVLKDSADRLGELKVGDFWRMGNNQSTTFKTPVDLTFGSVKVPKGAYSLWLKRVKEDQFELTFNSQTGQWGTWHDPSKDVYQAPFKKEAIDEKDPVKTFNIKLNSVAKGGVLVLTWGTTLFKTKFEFAQ